MVGQILDNEGRQLLLQSSLNLNDIRKKGILLLSFPVLLGEEFELELCEPYGTYPHLYFQSRDASESVPCPPNSSVLFSSCNLSSGVLSPMLSLAGQETRAILAGTWDERKSPFCHNIYANFF